MGHHKLEKSRKLISSICKIGKVLGYVTKQEFPVDQGKRNSQAVDIAWLSEENQQFPIMIFEIESKATGAIANNPTKIFGKPNEHFEKPLFFFHIFLSTPVDSTKLEDLKYLFGRYNYRVYDVTSGEKYSQLLADITSQHRRLYNKIDIFNLFKSLDGPWKKISLEYTLSHLEKLNFSTSYLRSYALLSLQDSSFKEYYLRFLKKYISSPEKYPDQTYSNYWGDTWQIPIHLSLLTYYDTENKKKYLDKLIDWRENTSFAPMIAPIFGLSRDYAELIICLMPPFLGFLASLMKHYPRAIIYVADILKNILNSLLSSPPQVFFYSALWLLYIAIAASSDKHYNIARNVINDNGGISERFLFSPPDSIPFDNPYDTREFENWFC